MIDLGNRSTNSILIDKFACSYFPQALVSLCPQMKHIKKKTKQNPENTLKTEAKFSFFHFLIFAKYPSHLIWAMPGMYLSFSHGLWPTPPEFSSPELHENKRNQAIDRRDSIYKDSCLLPACFEILWLLFIWPYNINACVCLTCTGMKSRLKIENILNTHPNTFNLNQCQTTHVEHVNKLSDLFLSYT